VKQMTGPLIAVLLVLAAGVAAQQPPTADDKDKRIEQLEKEKSELLEEARKANVAAQQKIELTADEQAARRAKYLKNNIAAAKTQMEAVCRAHGARWTLLLPAADGMTGAWVGCVGR
jgi:hypothetical protein